jgi:ABC-2 type transport system permease protein
MAAMILQLLYLFIIDGLFLGLLLGGIVLPLALAKRATYAVLKRNFLGYFSNPSGYVFLCLFVCLTSIGAFFRHGFFSSNLANLDQLNGVLPWIMLIFIPTITMSIWADERRQGTDELLLTLPAADFDIVVGKYLAAASIFTVSLIFSQLSSYAVLVSLTLGDMDAGLIFTTYLGYWFMGLAMLAVGMVASFLTSNLTVGFILGAAMNAPLVLAQTADLAIARASLASSVSRWSLAAQFDDFGRGVISIASTTYFLLVAALGVYLSIVLIGRRHWFNSSEGQSRWRVLGYAGVSIVSGIALAAMLMYQWRNESSSAGNDASSRIIVAVLWGVLGGVAIGVASVSLVSVVMGFLRPDWVRRNMFDQYVVRAMSLGALVVGVSYFLSNYDFARFDMTRGQVSSLSPKTMELVRDLKYQHPIVIDAYLSAEMPERYAKTKYDLLSLLKEFQSLAGAGIQVNIHDNLERASEEAREAEAQYGIVPRPVTLLSRGSIREEQLILGVGFRCGLEKVSVPFLDYGVPVEYELVRSLTTVAQGERSSRKKVFVVNTDAQMMGGFTMNMMSPQQIPEQALIGELRKQYTVESLDLTEPLSLEKVKPGDVMLVVQPSSLGPQQMANLVDAVKKGVPAAIFEDPAPAVLGHVPGTGEPKRPSGFGAPPQPKGDIRTLWRSIGVMALGDTGSAGEPTVDLVWQSYNPYKQLALEGISPELVFVRQTQPTTPAGQPAFNPEEPVVSTLEEVLLPFPGGVIRADGVEGIEFTELVRTGDEAAGRVGVREWTQARTDRDQLAAVRGSPTGKQYVLAAQLTGKQPAEPEKQEDPKADDAEANIAPRSLNVIYVADIDCLHSQFVDMRARPENELFGDVKFNFDNVSFVLNVIDHLGGDDRFLAIRTRKFSHPTLRAVERETERSRAEMEQEIAAFRADYKKRADEADQAREESLKKFRDELEKLKARQERGEEVDYNRLRAIMEELEIQTRVQTQISENTKRSLEQETERKIEKIQLANELQIYRIQNWFKAWAILLPPIPPLLLGLVVFARRRILEREGISKTRMR